MPDITTSYHIIRQGWYLTGPVFGFTGVRDEAFTFSDAAGHCLLDDDDVMVPTDAAPRFAPNALDSERARHLEALTDVLEAKVQSNDHENRRQAAAIRDEVLGWRQRVYAKLADVRNLVIGLDRGKAILTEECNAQRRRADALELALAPFSEAATRAEGLSARRAVEPSHGVKVAHLRAARAALAVSRCRAVSER